MQPIRRLFTRLLITILPPILLLISLILLILVSLSVPITHSIYVAALDADISVPVLVESKQRTLIGLWGTCTIPMGTTTFLFFNDNTSSINCTSPQAGYTISSPILDILPGDSGSDIQQLLSTLNALFVIHPIAAISVFISLTTLISSWFVKIPLKIFVPIYTFFLWLATILTNIAFFVDIGHSVAIKKLIKDITIDMVHISPGNAVWLVLVASILLTNAALPSCIGVVHLIRATGPGGAYYLERRQLRNSISASEDEQLQSKMLALREKQQKPLPDPAMDGKYV